MSQCDIDAEFEGLLNDTDMAEVEAMVGEVKAAVTAVEVDAMPAIKAQQSTITSAKPTIGKKRQLLVPQTSNKRVSTQVKVTSGTSDDTTLPGKDSKAAPEPEPAPAHPEPSAASSPAKAKPAEDATDKAAEDVEGQDSEKDDTAMTDAAAEGEPEVQSPLKKAPEPEPDADEPAAAEEAAKSDSDKPATQAPALPATSSKALAAGKRKGLLVAKSATDPDAARSAASKPSAVKPKPAKPTAPEAAGSTATAGASSEAAAPKMPHAQTAFFFFTAEKRAGLKESFPGLSMGEYAKKMGEMWKELSEDEKKPYNDQAIADKERVKSEIAAMDSAVKEAIEKAAAAARAAKKQKKAGKEDKAEEPQETKKSEKAAAKEAKKSEKAAAKAEELAKKQAAKAAKAEAAKKEKSGFKMFHSSQFGSFKADNPGMELIEVNGLIQKAWDALEQTEKEAYITKAEDAAEAAAAVRAAIGKKPAGRPKGAGKRSKRASAGSDGEEAEGSDQEGGEAAVGSGGSRRRAAAAEDEDDDSDREDVDWETNAATAIFVHDDSSFSVARQGLMLTEYGKVDRAKAKSRALHGDAGSSSEADLPVSVEQVEEYEKSCQKFWAAVKSRMHKGSLDLEELEEGSPLELCYVLGKLQERGQLLDPSAKRPKGDLDMVKRLPVMRLSMVVQRLIEMERREAGRFKAAAETLMQAYNDKENHRKSADEAVASVAAMLEGN